MHTYTLGHMHTNKTRMLALTAAAVVGTFALSGCGAGSRTVNENATEVTCDYDAPAEATTVDVLAYNSSAIDPFTDTMVASCTTDDVTVKHDPIDFGGQVTKTTATLAGDTGSYDIIETYGFVIPCSRPMRSSSRSTTSSRSMPTTTTSTRISESMRTGMSYDGQLYALPMQAQMFVMAYRADVFEDLGLEVPTTFDEMIDAARGDQGRRADGVPDRPAVARHRPTSRRASRRRMNSLGADFVDGRRQRHARHARRPRRRSRRCCR